MPALLSRGREATDPQSTGENTGGGKVAEKQNPAVFCVSGILFIRTKRFFPDKASSDKGRSPGSVF